ncbi:hypothetical protein, partial [Paenibacillus hemerocallicola]|uniref:hypothetical protein n=1 Tax=Paenibacillus hemerocallicola TaxID=1172614 RepID=UPI001C4032CE
GGMYCPTARLKLKAKTRSQGNSLLPLHWATLSWFFSSTYIAKRNKKFRYSFREQLKWGIKERLVPLSAE